MQYNKNWIRKILWNENQFKKKTEFPSWPRFNMTLKLCREYKYKERCKECKNRSPSSAFIKRRINHRSHTEKANKDQSIWQSRVSSTTIHSVFHCKSEVWGREGGDRMKKSLVLLSSTPIFYSVWERVFRQSRRSLKSSTSLISFFSKKREKKMKRKKS